ncbi:MAG: NAD(P)H-hydrate dehydratase [Candidatus Omnitrophota bacterium]|nr:MAG: NAD(P)H-hydrate dehydratase [Candidatus Omnitrophota bacterium]
MTKFNIAKRRKKDTHKGDYGHLLIIAGSVGMSGAAFLASEAALRSGCGLVTLGLHESLNIIAEKKLTEVITKPLPETKQKSLSKEALSKIIELLKKKNAAAIGPGLSQHKQTKALLLSLLPKLNVPAVLDADGLNALIGRLSIIKKIKSPLVMSPHPGEMARLIKVTSKLIQKNRKKVASDFAKKYDVTLVLKGYNTVVADPRNKTYVNKTGNPGMATAGSGDVLTGIIGSFLAQGTTPYEAAKLAVYIHGLAGDLAAKETGEVSLIAGDILAKVPEAIKKIKKMPA